MRRGIATYMTGRNIRRAPQPAVLRHSQQQHAARHKCPRHRLDHVVIMVDMLDDVECADGIEFAFERYVCCVKLHERRSLKMTARDRQTVYERFGADELRARV